MAGHPVFALTMSKMSLTIILFFVSISLLQDVSLNSSFSADPEKNWFEVLCC